ncbi:MAG: methyltransferase domain-containing protein [Phycisphaerales bacterium]|nr:MAG: methyltransferase domain-containing protein [Phycisphaerales bacterium]
MTGQSLKSARAVAAEVLSQCDPARNHIGAILDRFLDQTHERQRATDLVMGATRNRFAIDSVIAEYAGARAERIPVRLLSIIRVGVYELIHSPQTGEYSIVNEAVENAKAFGSNKQAGFVNAVLRQIVRHISNRQISLAQANAARTVPQTPVMGCEFDTDFLPDPAARPAEYLAATSSLPKWLVADWLDTFGFEQTRDICFASSRRPSLYVRPNSLRTTAQELSERFQQANVESEIIPQVQLYSGTGQTMIRVKSPRAVTQLRGFADGLFSVQDISASQAVRMLAPPAGWAILDLCAAPGVKTTQLAEASGDSARIIATDINPERLEKVRENTARLGLKSVEIVSYRACESRLPQIAPFDAVLLDVPCSNTGVLAKRIEARFRITPKAVKELIKIQAGLLDRAAKMLRPGGKICYSTCSIQDTENYEVIREFLLRNRDFSLESEELFLPSADEPDHDGGYVAVVTRRTKERQSCEPNPQLVHKLEL